MQPLFKVGQEVQANSTFLIEHLLQHKMTTKGIVKSITISSSTLKHVPNVYQVKFEGATYTIGIAESELQAVSNTFGSQKEIWEYLLSGGKVVANFSKNVYAFVENEFTCIVIKNPVAVSNYIDFSSYKDFTKYIEPKVVNWYDNIPKSGILCWVYDNEPNDKTTCRIVLGYTGGSFTTSGMNWKYATPLTQEEVTNLTLQQEPEYKVGSYFT